MFATYQEGIASAQMAIVVYFENGNKQYKSRTPSSLSKIITKTSKFYKITYKWHYLKLCHQQKRNRYSTIIILLSRCFQSTNAVLKRTMWNKVTKYSRRVKNGTHNNKLTTSPLMILIL